MRIAWIIVGLSVLVGCGGSGGDEVSSDLTVAFDSSRVAAQIDSVMSQLTEFQLVSDFGSFNSIYTTESDGSAAGDGSFFASTAEFLDYMAPVFESVDSIPSFEWLHYRVYPLSSKAALFAGQYTEAVVMAGGDPVDVVGAFTALFINRGGAWEIVHVHTSHVD